MHYLASKYIMKAVLFKVPFLGGWIKVYEDLVQVSRVCGFKPGHFYRPIPSREEVRINAKRVISSTDALDIDLKIDKQF